MVENKHLEIKFKFYFICLFYFLLNIDALKEIIHNAPFPTTNN